MSASLLPVAPKWHSVAGTPILLPTLRGWTPECLQLPLTHMVPRGTSCCETPGTSVPVPVGCEPEVG